MSTINTQITDAIAENHASLLGCAASNTLALLDAVMSETLGMAMHNAVTAQHGMQMIGNASVVASCARMLNTIPAPPPPPKVEIKVVEPNDPPPVSPTDANIQMKVDAAQAAQAVNTLVHNSQIANTNAQFAAQSLQDLINKAGAAFKNSPAAGGTDGQGGHSSQGGSGSTTTPHA